MAEINVQRKGPSAWLWLLGLAAVLGLVWMFVAMSGDDQLETATTAVPAVVPPARDMTPPSGMGDTPAPEVASFLSFVAEPAGSPAGMAHDYAASGIRQLTGALSALTATQTAAGGPVREQFAAFEAKANQIQSDPKATGHAGQVREVFTSAADLMSTVQKDRLPDAADLSTQIAEMRTAGAGIDADRPLLDQTPQVRAFFDRAAAAVRAMSAAPAVGGQL